MQDALTRLVVQLFAWRWSRRMINALVKAQLRSPLHGMISGHVMLITFTGRRSGRRYTTPVSYARDGETVYCFTDAPWWKNLRGGAPVTLRLRGHDLKGMAEAVSADQGAIAEGLRFFFREQPTESAVYGVTLDADGQPNLADVASAAQRVVMIRARLHQ